MSLINGKIGLALKWTKYCVISEILRVFRQVDPNVNPILYELVTLTAIATFHINDAKSYFSIVTLSKNNNIKFLENIKQGFTRKTSWNKYRSKVTTQTKKQ